MLCAVVAVGLQIAVNYLNDYADGVRGTDARRGSDAAGPRRLVASGVDPSHVLLAAAVAALAACAAGLVAVVITGRWWLIALGATCLVAAWGYTNGRHPYGYRGLGELAAFVFFGLVPALGTQYALSGSITVTGVAGSVICGLLSVSVMMVNNLRDLEDDAAHGKRTLMVRIASTGEVMLIVVFARPEQEKIDDLMGAIAAEFPEITSLLYVVNQKVNDTIADQEVITYRGRDYINEEMEGLQFRIGPKSFYQTNSLQAYELYKVARRMACLKPDDLVYDLYTGTGTIANFVARQVKKVVGIEYVPEAIADAKLNSEVNGIDNTIFFAGDMKDVLTDGFIAEHGRPDVMIIDPPRAGMHEDVVNVILNAHPERIVYVSCNPATQARDLALMDGLYRVDEVQPVDMFPHTHHVENVVRMTRR